MDTHMYVTYYFASPKFIHLVVNRGDVRSLKGGLDNTKIIQRGDGLTYRRLQGTNFLENV